MSGNIKDPNWIYQDINNPELNKNTKRSIKYYRQLKLAKPVFADDEIILDAGDTEAEIRRKHGTNIVTDHIVPINHPYVCGLHWEGNLQNIHHKENETKSNHYWPDMWAEQYDLLIKMPWEQFELAL